MATSAPNVETPPSLWRNQSYLLLWGGQLLSNIGSGTSRIAFPLLALMITHSPALASLAGALNTFTYVLCILPAGIMLDRWDRKRVMIYCDVGRALCLLTLALASLAGVLNIWQLCIIMFIEGGMASFFDIAELACIPQVVAKEQLPAAMGRTQITFGLSSLLGPSLGGLLYAIRAWLPFMLDGFSYSLSVVSLFLIKIPFQKQRTEEKRRIREELREGWHWVWGQPIIRTLALLTGGNNIFGVGITLVVVILAQQLHASSTTIGVIFSAGGVGGLCGAVLVGNIQRWLNFNILMIGVLWLFMLSWVGFLFVTHPFWLGAILFFVYALSSIYNATYIGYRLALTPDRLQARMNSVVRLFALGTQSFGLIMTGLLLQYRGTRETIIIAIIGQLILAVLALASSHLRHVSSVPSTDEG